LDRFGSVGAFSERLSVGGALVEHWSVGVFLECFWRVGELERWSHSWRIFGAFVEKNWSGLASRVRVGLLFFESSMNPRF